MDVGGIGDGHDLIVPRWRGSGVGSIELFGWENVVDHIYFIALMSFLVLLALDFAGSRVARRPRSVPVRVARTTRRRHHA
jgi:hypothetical protein